MLKSRHPSSRGWRDTRSDGQARVLIGVRKRTRRRL